jgi:hypothetical protein
LGSFFKEPDAKLNINVSGLITATIWNFPEHLRQDADLLNELNFIGAIIAV